MIRAFATLTFFGFLVVALFTIQMMRPGTIHETDAEVSRTASELSLLPQADIRPQARPDPELPEGDARVARIAALAKPASVTEAPQADSQARATAAVLAGLGAAMTPTPGVEEASADPMRDMTSDVLQGLGIARKRAQSQTQAAPDPGALQQLIVQALREGQSDAYIDALLNEAADAGKIAVPQALVTSEGRVDTSAILDDIVSRALNAANGQPETGPAESRVVGGEGVEVRVVQQANGDTKTFHFYTVKKGDSLGAIAVKFYGDVSKYAEIFDANRALLSSPNRIKTGQRLVIPVI